MKIINQWSQIQSIVATYERNMGFSKNPKILENVRLLEQLPKDSATAEDVLSIVGENFRLRVAGPFICNECGEKREAVVELGEEPDYDSSTANICFECLRKAIALEETK